MKIPEGKKPVRKDREISAARKLLRIPGSIALVLSLLVCTWLLTGTISSGWIAHADHYGDAFRTYGCWMLGLAGGMTLAVILYFCRQDLIAAILGVICYVPMLGILLRAMDIAETNGWSGQTERNFGVNASEVWRNGGLPNVLTLILLLLLTLTRYFSYDAAVRRQRKRDAKAAKDNAPAPSILEDD